MKKTLFALIGAVIFLAAITVQAQTLAQDFSAVGQDAINGPWAVGGGFEHSSSGTGANFIFCVVSYDLVTNISNTGFSSGPVVGYDEGFEHGQKQFDAVSGGWTFSFSGHWLSFIGSTGLTNMLGTLTVHQLIATPRGGSDIGSITGGTASLDVYDWKGLHLKPSFEYDNRNGQKGFNGNFLGGMLILTHSF